MKPEGLTGPSVLALRLPSLALPELNIFAGVAIPQRKSGRWRTILLMMMEDAMTHYTDTDSADGHTLYVLVASLLAAAISLLAIWIFEAATYAPAVLA